MIIEFIGSTGAGKTTLIQEVQRRLAKTVQVTTSIDLVTSMIGLQGTTNATAQNLIQELVSLPYFLRALYRYKAFIVQTIRMFTRNTNFSINTINNLRSLERKIGVYEITRRSNQDCIILMDEGPILSAHMFVFTDAIFTPEEIAEFAGLLPLPDLIVYLRVPVDTLVKRTMERPDPPRETNSNNRSSTENFAKRAVSIFDQIVEFENIQQRLMIVENPDVTEPHYNKVADNIAQFILDFEASNG